MVSYIANSVGLNSHGIMSVVCDTRRKAEDIILGWFGELLDDAPTPGKYWDIKRACVDFLKAEGEWSWVSKWGVELSILITEGEPW